MILVPLGDGRVLSRVLIWFDLHFGTHTSNRIKVNLRGMSVEEETVISQERDCVSVAIVVKIGGSETDAEEMGSPGLGVQLRVEF